MRGRKKALAAVIVCIALALGTLLPASGSAGGVYLMAVNDRVMDITAENVPFLAGGVLYVPYIMLSNQATNINLGVSALYSTTRRTVLVTDGQRGVTFDLQNNTGEDINGTPITARAMTRNTMVFIPIDWLCQYFGTINCTRTRTPYGTLIRVTNSAAILSDQELANAAGPQLEDNLRRYLESVTPTPPPATAAPAPSESPEVSEPPSGAELYLALRAGNAAADCAQLLEDRGLHTLVLFSLEDLARDGGLVRRIVGAGHTAGLALESGDLDTCLAEARRGRELLAAAARYNALVVSAPNLDGEGRKALEDAGYVIWSATVSGADYSSGSALVRGLDPRRVNFLEIQCGVGELALLRSALSMMEEENCQIYQPTAPALS